ncbi:MAG: high-affinity Fe2+/Pb2+ permease [Candidatus Fonsibacter sp.]|nr:high-affinity Fe2+/Pb2+ permease [Candidatus Fonsibacter sp.]
MTETLTPYLSSFFILFREGFEALLIAILIFTYLDKMNARHQRPAVIWGLIAGVVVSLLTALAVKKIAAITHAHEELFEGSVMLIASGMLAYVAYFSHNAKQHVKGKVDKAVSTGNPFFLSLTVFFAIVREGFEVVLFYAALFTSTIYSPIPVIAGAITGTLALIFVYFVLRKITKIMPVGTFFRISSILLLLLSVYFGYEGAKEFYAGLRELKII